MNTLREAAQEYIDLRRNLGFKLRDPGAYLLDFVSFMEERGASYITSQLALTWAQHPSGVLPSCWAQRLSAVRGFARHRSAVDVRTEIPPPGLLPHRPQRARPYLYSKEEIAALLGAALRMPDAESLRRWTYYCFFGLLSVAGLRFCEACALELEDVDLKARVLTVRSTKFGKSRLVPLHPSTCRVLKQYLRQRERHWAGRAVSPYLFVGISGRQLYGTEVRQTFYRLSRQIGLRGTGKNEGPRLHDFRHSFAMNTLVQWYRSGEDPERCLPVLSAYLGHLHYAHTYWYLSNSPELMRAAMQRMERRWGGQAMTLKTDFAPILEQFFTQRLMQQRQASPHTIAFYRDTFRQLLKFAQQRLHQQPSQLTFASIDAPLISAFLDDLEKRHGVSARSRNLRLTAVRSLFRYAAFEMPTYASQIQRVLAIQSKRFNKALVPFLTRPEVEALLDAPDQRTWYGRRDHAFILMAVQTGLRVSEMTSLKASDLVLSVGAPARVTGKGRKERCVPLAKTTVAVLKSWKRELQSRNTDILFPSLTGKRLSVHGVQYLLNKHRGTAAKACPSLNQKKGHRPSPAAHDGDGSASGRSGSVYHRTVLGARVGGNNADLSRRHDFDEAEGSRQDHSAQWKARMLPSR